jgi:hypothetical protein
MTESNACAKRRNVPRSLREAMRMKGFSIRGLIGHLIGLTII